jgi:hypothetical protein
MLVTELGIVIRARPLQLSNADSPMPVTVLGMMVFLHPLIRVLDAVSMIALHPLRESYLLFSVPTFILPKLLHPLKAPYPMLVTELPMVALVKPLQKAYLQVFLFQLFTS